MNPTELEELWQRQYPGISTKQHQKAQLDQQEMKVGDYVRLAMKKNLFEKGYKRRYTHEVF